MKGTLMLCSKTNSTLIRIIEKMKMIVMQHEGKVTTTTTKHKEEMELVKVCLKQSNGSYLRHKLMRRLGKPNP
jgi:hypothetical protein